MSPLFSGQSDDRKSGLSKARNRTPRYRVAVVGRSLRKLVGLLEAIPPSMATYEPWKVAYDFTASWLRDCEFLLSDNAPGARYNAPMTKGKSAAASGDLTGCNPLASEDDSGTLAAAALASAVPNLVCAEGALTSIPISYDIYCLM